MYWICKCLAELLEVGLCEASGNIVRSKHHYAHQKAWNQTEAAQQTFGVHAYVLQQHGTAQECACEIGQCKGIHSLAGAAVHLHSLVWLW